MDGKKTKAFQSKRVFRRDSRRANTVRTQDAPHMPRACHALAVDLQGDSRGQEGAGLHADQ